MSALYQVAFIGLSDAERAAVTAALRRLPEDRSPHYALTQVLDLADMVIADAENTPSVKLVLATERLRSALWVGTPPPMGSVAVVDRPLDPDLLLRELDALVVKRLAGPGARVRALPASGPEREPLLVRAQAQHLPPPAPKSAPSALLVDDSEIALRFLETRLQRWSLVTERALSSGRAVELLAHTHYDLVFLDVELGTASDLDGLALCQHIKRMQRPGGRPPAVVMVSAHATQSDRARGSLAGADAYLGKPLDEVELQRLLMRQGLKPLASATR